RLPYARPRRPDVREGARAVAGGPADLRSAAGIARSFSALVAGPGLHLLRPGLRPRSDGHLAHQANRRSRRADHVSQLECEPPDLVEWTDAALPRERCGRRRALAP